MDRRSKRQRKQQELWELLGQVTSACEWHKGVLQQLKRRGFNTAHAEFVHQLWRDEMRNLESQIRTDMQLIKQNIPADK
jgi:hypothetical protein